MTLYASRNVLTKQQLKELALCEPRAVRLEGTVRGKLASFTLDQLKEEEGGVEVQLPRGVKARVKRTPAGLLVR